MMTKFVSLVAHPTQAIAVLGSSDVTVADRAEWMLVKAGATVLPQLREAIQSNDAKARQRSIRIVAWQGDRGAIVLLQADAKEHPEDGEVVQWALQKIQSLGFAM